MLRGVADDLHDLDRLHGMAHCVHCVDGTMLCLHSHANHVGEGCVLPAGEHWSLQNGKVHPQVSKFAALILLGGIASHQPSDAIASPVIISRTVARNALAANAD